MKQSERQIELLRFLLNENQEYANLQIPSEDRKQRELLRALMNVRQPRGISEEFLAMQDEYLQEELKNRGIVSLKSLAEIEKALYLWRGDITTLEVDAIVNAANSRLLGCFIPNHRCIDNAIHSFAGIQLRLACDALMKKQGHEEPVGKAQITSAYNLPSKYVIHTVGPIISGTLTQRDSELLESCYRSCLELASENDLKSIAFCCISTGEFRFPSDVAAQIAVRTVKKYLSENNKEMKVVFNVFKEEDERLYRELLG